MSAKKVYCIGELLIDFVAENQGKDLKKAVMFTKKAGGAPANVAAAIAHLGGISEFVGSVGKDPFGEYLIHTIERLGVGTSHMQKSDVFTTLAFVSLAEDGERDFVFSRGADRELNYDPALGSHFSGSLVHFGAATALLGGALEVAYQKYLEDAIQQKAFICFDPNFREDLWKGNEAVFVQKCRPYIKNAHLAKFSLEEAQLLSAKENIKEACETLHEIGVKTICITLGKDGTYVSHASYQETVGSISVNAIDTTGAGDAFIGCLLKQLSDVESPEKSIDNYSNFMEMLKKANIAGALTTTKYGAIPALPTLDDILNV